MVRKRKGHPRSVVKIIEVHPKYLRLISTVTSFVLFIVKEISLIRGFN